MQTLAKGSGLVPVGGGEGNASFRIYLISIRFKLINRRTKMPLGEKNLWEKTSRVEAYSSCTLGQKDSRNFNLGIN